MYLLALLLYWYHRAQKGGTLAARFGQRGAVSAVRSLQHLLSKYYQSQNNSILTLAIEISIVRLLSIRSLKMVSSNVLLDTAILTIEIL